MTDDQANQSIFSEAIEDWQAPPEVDMTPEGKQKREAQNKKRLLYGGGAFGLLILVIILFRVANSYINRPGPPVAYPTPTLIPTPASTKMQDELARLQFLVDQANPNEEFFAPPSVDMNVRL